MIDRDAGGAFSTQELIEYLVKVAETPLQAVCQCGEFHDSIADLDHEESLSLEGHQDPLEWYMLHMEQQQRSSTPNGYLMILSPDAEMANRWRISSYHGQERVCTVYVDDRFDSPTRIFSDFVTIANRMPLGKDPLTDMYVKWDFQLLTEKRLQMVMDALIAVASVMGNNE